MMGNERCQKRKKFSLKLRTKIFLVCMVLVTLFALMWAVWERVIERQIEDSYYSSTHALLRSQYSGLSMQIEQIIDSITRMCLSEDFNRVMEDFFMGDYDDPSVRHLSRVSVLMEDWIGNSILVKEGFIHTDKGDFFQISRGMKRNFHFENTSVYQQMCSNSNQEILFGNSGLNEFYNTTGNVIPMVFRVSHYNTQEPMVIIALLNETSLYQSINSRIGRGEMLLLNENGVPVTMPRDANIGALLSDTVSSGGVQALDGHLAYDGAEYIVISSSVGDALPWILCSFYLEEDLLGTAKSMYRLSWLLLGSMIAISFLFSLTISRSITRPLELLSQKMEDAWPVKSRDHYFEYPYRDEVGSLGDHFNRMMTELDDLVSQLRQEKEAVKIEQLLKRRAELKALQAQINPHFLYNTLDSISWMAFEAHAPKISDMTVALAALFRSGLSQGNDLIPISGEYTHVSNYLKIQKMRYEERFDYDIHLPDEIAPLYTVKLILQPLVENAIYHGIKESGRRGYIRVWCSDENGRIKLTVSDNGNGFAEREMDRINDNLDQCLMIDKRGYGIFNVNERIKLYFGMEYGLRFERMDGITYAHICLPRVSVDEVGQYVEYFDCRR